jgi:UDP-glucose:(heptosyl)LPS alpha-1,3-glucosyltransferase
MLRIAVVRRECGLGFGGAEAYCANVCTWLTEMGHNVTVVADKSLLPGLHFSRAPVWGRGSILKNLSFFLNSRQVLKAGNFELSYGLSRVAPVNVLRISDPLHAAWLDLGYQGGAKFRRIRPRHRMLLWMEAKAIKEAKAIVTNSQLVKNQVRYYYGVDAENVTVIYNGVDLKRFRPMTEEDRVLAKKSMGISDDVTVFVFAGSDLRRKGLYHLLPALAQFRKQPFILLVAGSMGNRDLKKRIEGIGLSQNVRLLGYVKDMERLYALADLFILPTHYDPFANTTLEAMACGTPALTTMQNGASEVVEKIAHWLVMERPSHNYINEALNAFTALPAKERRLLGEKAHLVAQKFSWQRHAEELITILSRYSIPITTVTKI